MLAVSWGLKSALGGAPAAPPLREGQQVAAQARPGQVHGEARAALGTHCPLSRTALSAHAQGSLLTPHPPGAALLEMASGEGRRAGHEGGGEGERGNLLLH